MSCIARCQDVLIWHVWILQIGWASVMRMGADLRDLFLYEAFLYYNPLLLVVSHDFLIESRLSFPYSSILYPWSNIFSPNLVLQTMMVWLWGINLWFFSQANVNYAKIFDLDQNHLTHREIWKVLITANAMTVIVCSLPNNLYWFFCLLIRCCNGLPKFCWLVSKTLTFVLW